MTTATANRLNGTDGANGIHTLHAEPVTSTEPPVTEPEPTNSEIVLDSFERAAFGFSITPERLFVECRHSGLTDAEVREVLTTEEAVAFGDDGYKAAYSGDGQYFIQRNESYGENASMRELLSECADEIATPKAVRQQNHVANELRAKGIELNEREAVLLQACHVLSKGFQRGVQVSTGSLKRVLVNYHPQLFESRTQVSSVLDRLASRQIVGIGGQKVRLREPLKQPKKPAPSKWSKLTDDPEREAVLLACSDCMPCGFVNRNVAQRHAVWCLMAARHCISKKEFNRRVKELTAGGILELTFSKGADALRLTVEASEAMHGGEFTNIPRNNGKLDQQQDGSESVPADTTNITADNSCTKLIDIEALRERFSSEAERQRLQAGGNYTGNISVQAAVVYEILHRICFAVFCPFDRLMKTALAGGMDFDDLQAALQELHSREMVMPIWCDRTQSMILEVNSRMDHCACVSVDDGVMMELQDEPERNTQQNATDANRIDIEGLRERFSSEAERKARQKHSNYTGKLSVDAAVIYEVLNRIAIADQCEYLTLVDIVAPDMDEGDLLTALFELDHHEMVFAKWCDRSQRLHLEVTSTTDHCRLMRMGDAVLMLRQAAD